MKWSEDVMKESFYFSNMSPQVPSFNRGVWKKLEEKVRDWAVIYDSILVVTGPILASDLKKIGPNEVCVPKAYYKVIIDFKKEYFGSNDDSAPTEKPSQKAAESSQESASTSTTQVVPKREVSFDDATQLLDVKPPPQKKQNDF
jgi:endonuclease G